MRIMGMSWANIGPFHASATVWLDDDTGKVSSSDYNFGDSTGFHNPRRPHAAAKPYTIAIRAMVDAAKAEAIAERDYKLARRRDTTIDNLKYAFLVTEGRGGHVIHSDESRSSSSTLSGYGLTPELLAEIDRLKIPFVDTRAVPDGIIAAASYGFPMWPNKPDKVDPAPWGGLSMAPIPILAAMWANIGAVVRNVEMVMPTPDQIRGMEAWEKAGLKAYQSGDETGVFEAMMAAREQPRKAE